MNEKLTNLYEIPAKEPWESAIEKINHNFTEISTRVGLQFTGVLAEIEPTKWEDNNKEKIPSIDEPFISVTNKAPTPAARAYITVGVPAPESEHVRYTDVLAAPHHEDTDTFLDQLKEITRCGVMLVAHKSLDKLEDDVEGLSRLNLMFWAVNSKPHIKLAFNIILI